MSARIIVFDVNETLLDLAAMDDAFEEAFGDRQARGRWFSQLLSLAMTSAIVGRYRNFADLGRAALQMTAGAVGVSVSAERERRIVEGMGRLPAHPDVVPALTRLRAAGLRLAALTNSAPAVAQAQIRHAGLTGYIEQVFSVDAAGRYKPAPEPYRYAAHALGVDTADVRMVAAHVWDIEGAMAAGCAGAYVCRSGVPFNPLAPQPDVIAPDLESAAERIVEIESAAGG
ncbi:MAG TPA: haloacid dehalogenase type II [Gammaproteobacteria bacterium]|nr:haloacid dehalogenase type II [Gammaproteobacteria bacterium]